MKLWELQERRKHVSQMTKKEQDTIWKRLKGVQEHQWKLRSHAIIRVFEKEIHVSVKDIVSTIKNSTIIEYKTKYNKGRMEERVVLRSNAIANEEYNLNVVFSLTTKEIVSVWLNHTNDLHSTLDWNIYDKDLVLRA